MLSEQLCSMSELSEIMYELSKIHTKHYLNYIQRDYRCVQYLGECNNVQNTVSVSTGI